jgi:hypothetical protein
MIIATIALVLALVIAHNARTPDPMHCATYIRNRVAHVDASHTPVPAARNRIGDN